MILISSHLKKYWCATTMMTNGRVIFLNPTVETKQLHSAVSQIHGGSAFRMKVMRHLLALLIIPIMLTKMSEINNYNNYVESRREVYRQSCKYYLYENDGCAKYSRQIMMNGSYYVDFSCDGNCARMKRFDKKLKCK